MRTLFVCLLAAAALTACEQGKGTSSPPAPTPAPGAPAPAVPARPEPAVKAITPAPAAGAPAKTEGKTAALLQLQEKYRDLEKMYGDALDALARGDRNAAHLALDGVLALDPGHLEAASRKARLLSEDKRFDDALSILQTALEVRQGEPFLIQERAMTQFEAGERDEALKTIQQLTDSGAKVPGARYLRAVILAEKGEREGAVAGLADALENGYMDVKRIQGEAAFAGLRDHERFQALVKGLDETMRAATDPELIMKVLREQEEATRLPPESEQSAASEEMLWAIRDQLSTKRGIELPAQELLTLDGRRLGLRDYLGKPLLIQVWGTWSAVSQKQVANIAGLRQEPGLEGLEIVLLAYEVAQPSRSRDAAKDWLKAQKIDLPCAVIPLRFAADLGVRAYPTTVFVGADGKAYLNAHGIIPPHVLRDLAINLVDPPASSTPAK